MGFFPNVSNIKKYTTLQNYEKLGYELITVTEIIVSEGMMMEVSEEISKIRRRMVVYNVTGDSDILVIAKFKSRQTLSDLTKTI